MDGDGDGVDPEPDPEGTGFDDLDDPDLDDPDLDDPDLDDPDLAQNTTHTGAVSGSAVNTGSGPQHVTINQILEERRRRGLITVDGQPLDLFVPPRNWPWETVLPAAGVILLHGAPGSGRYAAALHLLTRRRSAHDRPVRELFVEDVGDGHLLDPEEVQPGDRIVLDLRRLPAHRVDRVCADLRGLRGAARGAEALIVAIVPDELGSVAAAAGLPPAQEVGRPDARRVLTQHLDLRGLDDVEAEIDWTTLEPRLQDAAMAEVAQLAFLVDSARAVDRESGPDRWLDAALSAWCDDTDTVATQVRKLSDARSRALLLAAGLFAGHPPAVVAAAEQQLLAAVGHSVAAAEEFVGPGVGKRLDELGARVVNGAVVFRVPDFDRTVRRHFWAQFPVQHDPFRDWMLACTPLLHRRGVEPGTVIGRFAEECLALDRIGDLTQAVTTWARNRRTNAFARNALDRGVLHQDRGSDVRRWCYWRAQNRALPPGLAEVVIGTCKDALAPRYPRESVVRLRHLARHNDVAIRIAATDALCAAVDRHDAVLRALLGQLAGAPERGPALFLEVVTADRLLRRADGRGRVLGDRQVQELLTDCWSGVYRYVAREQYAPRLHEWFAATTAHSDTDHLLEVLVEACGASTHQVAILFTAGHDWAQAAPSDIPRRRTAHRLGERIHRSRVARKAAPSNGESQ